MSLKASDARYVPETWLDYLWSEAELDRHYYELAAIWILRERLGSGTIYVEKSRRYTLVESYLIPKLIWSDYRTTVHELTGTPLTAAPRLAQRKQELQQACEQVEALIVDSDSKQLSVRGKQLIYQQDQADLKDARIEQLGNSITAQLEPTAITDIIL